MMSATAALQQNDRCCSHSVDAPRPVPGRDALRHFSRAEFLLKTRLERVTWNVTNRESELPLVEAPKAPDRRAWDRR